MFSQTGIAKSSTKHAQLCLAGVFYAYVCTVILAGQLCAEEERKVRFHETFADLNAWEPLTFRKIERHSNYKTKEVDDDRVLQAESENAASALVYKKQFHVQKCPIVSWRWKIQEVYENGNAKTQGGDDFPIRLYIIFEYNPDKAGFFRKTKYAAAKKLHGQYPPDSTLN